jgi:glycosyltransferase involved in cell wall biosynthesis
MNILFYSPFNNRSRDTESLMFAFRNQGHKVISLSQAEGIHIHPYLSSQGIETLTHLVENKTGLWYYIRHIFFLVNICRQRKIDIIYSHLESANFVSAIAQFFMPARVFINRHHIDEAALQGFDNSLFYRLTYRLARKIIVVSGRAAQYMEKVENVPRSKIIKINLAYDFSLYAMPNPDKVLEIRRDVGSKLVLLTVCRLTKYKRADLSIKLLKTLVHVGMDVKLILLGSGEEEVNLKKLAEAEGVMDKMVMPGYVANVIDYLAASDFLIHPSVLESSCVIVKEAGITDKPVIVCNGVGDFDEYLVHDVNGFITAKDNFVSEAMEIIKSNYLNKLKLELIGRNLHQRVLELFSVDKIIHQYDTLNSDMKP